MTRHSAWPATARDGRTVIWALRADAGRGRRGRAWVSPPRQPLRLADHAPRLPGGLAAQLGFVAASRSAALCGAVAAGLDGLSYKWPNDVLVNGCKIAGILLESEMTAVREAELSGRGGRHQPGGGAAGHRISRDLGGGGTLGSDPRHHAGSVLASFRVLGGALAQRGFRAGPGGVAGGCRITRRADSGPARGRHLVRPIVDIDEQGILLLDCAGECRRISAGEVFPAGR